MIINSTQKQPPTTQQSFKGRLFDISGRQIKSFDFADIFQRVDQMATRGNKNTDIYVKEHISKEAGSAGFSNSIRLAIENPLFGRQEFTQELHHATNEPVNADSCDKLWHLDILTRLRTNLLEDKGLRGGLIDEIRKSIQNKNYRDISPMKILTNLLEKNKSHDFPAERIEDFKAVADKLNDELILKGITSIEK